MPTYQYACTECGEQLEVVQRFSDDPLTVCPACEGRLRKVFSPVGVVFKGSGFYKTDSRAKASSGSTSTSTKTDGADTTTTKADSSSSSTKPDTSAASTPSSTSSKPSGDGAKVA